jgi:galactokinase
MSDAFERNFGRQPDVRASAPGRVNLIGEHTDYNDGFVLPIATPQRTRVELGRTDGELVRSWSEQRGAGTDFRIDGEQRAGDWALYVQGVTRALIGMGHRLGGFDVYVDSDLPLGGGVSSSAALETALARALREAFGLELSDSDLAAAGHLAENEWVGARTGVMDQLASSLASPGSALLIDCRSRRWEHVPVPDSIDILVIDSGQRHSLAGSEYNTRRRDCEQAARLLHVPALRDVAAGDPRIAGLPAPLDRRARHVVEENRRVLETEAAMRAGDGAALGPLLDASHESLRALFEVSTPEIDRLVELTRACGALGARLTGGGFGGSVVAVATHGDGAAVAENARSRYRSEFPAYGAEVLIPA